MRALQFLSWPRHGTAIAVAALAAALGASAARGVAQETSRGGSALTRVLTHDTLANGLEVITLENHTVPLATIEIAVRNGAFTQSPTEQGYAHLFEHLLFRSYGRRAPESFASAAARLDAAYNGSTSEETVSYYLILPSANLARGVHLLARLIREPSFVADDLERERAIVLGEIERHEADPVQQLNREVSQRLWGDAWGRKDVAGNAEALAAATPKLLEATYRRYYVPNNAALIVGGDVTPAQVMALAARELGDWRRAPDPFEANPIPQMPFLEAHRGVVFSSSQAANVTVILAWQGPSVDVDTQATYAADVLSDVLDRPTSTFQHDLVDSGIFQSISIGYQTLRRTGPITIFGITSREKLRGALTALFTELSRLGDSTYITDEELEDAKKAREVNNALALEHTSATVQGLAFWWSVAGLDYYRTYVDRMREQTRHDLAMYAKRYIIGRPMSVGVLTTPEGTEEARQILRYVLGGGTATAGSAQ
ncbi:MAG: insulinase family protein [Gemmatimonadaceae bacterium]|nr:insulinase family protein [Gemmatimonadaceae bacterium]